MTRTIFCLGARSHYENATSDLLEFFLDPQAEHGLGTLFIDALAEVAGLAGSYGNQLTVRREKQTENRKRLDLLVEDTSSLLVIENKHWATDSNPFAEYEAHARTLAADPPRACEFVLLGFEERDEDRFTPAPWRYVPYRAWLDAIEGRLAKATLDARWGILTQEFLDHLRMESHHFSPGQVAGMLRSIGADGGSRRRKQVVDTVAKITLHVRPRLEQLLGAAILRCSEWSNEDAGQGWPGGAALDFQASEHKSADAIVSLAIQYAAEEAVDPAEQLLLVSWVRAGAKARETLANFRRAELKRFGFTVIAGPSRDKYWSSGTAHLLPLPAAALDHAMHMLSKVYAALTTAEQGHPVLFAAE